MAYLKTCQAGSYKLISLNVCDMLVWISGPANNLIWNLKNPYKCGV